MPLCFARAVLCRAVCYEAAGTIHTDFERGFICAEVMHFDELKELGNEHAVKAAGKYRQEGKNYTVLDGDIIYFKFNVSPGSVGEVFVLGSWEKGCLGRCTVCWGVWKVWL